MFVRPPATVVRVARSRLSGVARAANQGAFLSDAAASGFTPSITVKIRFGPADDRTAELLDITPSEEAAVRNRVMRADCVAVILAVSSLPRDTMRGTAIEDVDTCPGGRPA